MVVWSDRAIELASWTWTGRRRTSRERRTGDRFDCSSGCESRQRKATSAAGKSVGFVPCRHGPRAHAAPQAGRAACRHALARVAVSRPRRKDVSLPGKEKDEAKQEAGTHAARPRWRAPPRTRTGQPHIVAYYRVQLCFLRRRAFFFEHRLHATPGPGRSMRIRAHNLALAGYYYHTVPAMLRTNHNHYGQDIP